MIMDAKPKSVFADWYEGGNGSGPGSSPEYTQAYRIFLEEFIRQHSIQSILDFGCGDWQFSRLVNWGDAMYYGVDEVESLIERLQKEYGGAKRRFSTQIEVLPVDLVIIKDVVQHLPNSEVFDLVKRFSQCKNILWVNDVRFDSINSDTPRKGYRPINMSAPPFNLAAKLVFDFGKDGKVAQWQHNGD